MSQLKRDKMLNKPKYTLFKNTSYALAGLLEIFQNEKSFRLQILLFAILSMIAWLLPIKVVYTVILQFAIVLPVFAEIVNSAIERAVDLVTLEYNEYAKRAKDAGSALVFTSFAIVFFIWVFTLAFAFDILS